jgi:tRNA(Ile)-lysidine synthase
MRTGLRRPILGLRRAETVALCEARGLRPVEDPSNRDARFLRNRVRHELLPLACELAGRDLVPVLTRQAALLRDDLQLLEELAAGVDPTDAAALASAPAPLARLAVRRWLRSCDPSGHPPDAATVERVLAVARGEVKGAETPGGHRVARTAGRLRLELH